VFGLPGVQLPLRHLELVLLGVEDSSNTHGPKDRGAKVRATMDALEMLD
jgi:hypothetical protein